MAAADPPAFSTGILTSNEANRFGRADLAAGNYGNAERHFRTAVEKNRTDVASWIGLAAAYDNLSRFDLADRAYREAVEIQGETFEIINNRGYSYLLRGDKRRAFKQFERALSLDPSNPVVQNNLHLLRSGERPTRDVPI
ncbi:tetratricopeptide repeat protein [Methylobacterium sp. WL64]|uniref:tetratricopeptide repeat protein n=1 Tax=Methylobacterium sp. WL64 TaxID=2603894 RepID=UPI001AED9E09|nr:tetratricopeptide repeat protein [Methylobacterium sp. WL64]